MARVANIADFRVEVDGRDITELLKGGEPDSRPEASKRKRKLLQELTLTDKRAGEADQLDLVIDDCTGQVALPRLGATIRVWLGWLQGSDVTPGLHDKGTYTVDEVEHSGAPDRITIRARSADFTSEIRTRRERSWHNTTLGAIVADIAKRNGLQVRCAPDLAAIAIPTLVQSREGDIALLRRLGREHDAVATVKNGTVLFGRKGSGATASGKPLPGLTLRRRDGDRHAYKVEKRDEAEGVIASYHDRRAGHKRDVTAGRPGKAKKLSRVYGSERSARRAASSEHGRVQRQPVTFSYDLALGRADALPEQRVQLLGFKPEIDATPWLITEVAHRLGAHGFTTSLQMEKAA